MGEVLYGVPGVIVFVLRTVGECESVPSIVPGDACPKELSLESPSPVSLGCLPCPAVAPILEFKEDSSPCPWECPGDREEFFHIWKEQIS